MSFLSRLACGPGSLRRVFDLLVCTGAQPAAPAQNTQPSQDDVRPATTTVFGDTGLWYVPTGEVLPKGRWSVSGYRTNWDRKEAFTRHLELPRDLRLRRHRPGGALRQRRRCSAASTPTAAPCGRAGPRWTIRAVPDLGHRLRRHPGRREIQPARALSAAAGGVCHPHDRQAPDRRRRRRPRHRQGRLHGRRRDQRRSAPEHRAVRLRRHHDSRPTPTTTT